MYVNENSDLTAVFNEKASAEADTAPGTDNGTAVTYVAVDDDNFGAATADTDATADTGEVEVTDVVYSLEGSDAAKFSIATSGDGVALSKVAEVFDFETKSSYSIAVVAETTRGAGDDAVTMYDRVSVTVEVVNNNDPGTVSLTQREPQVGGSVAASIDDKDGDVSYVEWQWYRLNAEDAANVGTTNLILPDAADLCPDEAVGSDSCLIEGATSASYTVTEYDHMADDLDTPNADEGRFLMVRATYNDKFNAVGTTPKAMADGVTDAAVQISDPANTAPEFGDQDRNTPGDQDETVTREVAENTDDGENVGEEFSAEDMDGDLLMYNLGGPDMDSFTLSKPASDGNSVNLLTKVDLDFETKAEYTVTIMAYDPSGASDMITVTVNVTNENDGASVRVNNAPAFDSDMAERSVDENTEAGMAVGDAVAATDPDGDADSLTYTLGGDDMASFAIDEMSGQVMTSGALDYETKSSYSVTVTATDTGGFGCGTWTRCR